VRKVLEVPSLDHSLGVLSLATLVQDQVSPSMEDSRQVSNLSLLATFNLKWDHREHIQDMNETSDLDQLSLVADPNIFAC